VKAILQRPGRRRAGQTMIFLLMICVILALVVLWNFDLHKIITVKLRAQNGGDAAALAAARWQGITLNLIGHLNVLQAVAISDGLARGQTDFPEARAIADLAARLCYVGPVTALAAAQLGAKNNGIYNNSAYGQVVASHGAFVMSQYPNQFPAQPYTNSPSPPTAWDDYGTMLLAVAGQGIAAMPDNARFYVDYSGDHLLLDPSFYDAVASSDWCWFYHHAYQTLRDYTGYQDWPPLPIIRDPEPINSEFFGLGLMKLAYLDSLPMVTSGMGAGDVDEVIALLEQIAGAPITSAVAQVSAQWYCYGADRWSAWTGLIPDGFPFRGTVRPEYNYVGADAAVRIETETDRATPGAGRRWVSWSAAAKPFGFLEGPERPNRYGLVLPAFHEIRLIPVDTATGTGGGSRPGWSTHIHDHLPPYTAQGLAGLTPGCWYCEQLTTWENASFRQTGINWLASYSDQCHQPGGGGGRSSGGTRRGH
jgi:hypothetical protein